jgi:ribonuclease BN (tRNA processing enzyme)
VPGPTSAASCYVVEQDGFRLVLDLGSGSLGPLAGLVGLDAVDAVLVSHLHADHYFDLCPLFVARRYSPGSPRVARLPVLGPEGIRSQVAVAYGDGTEDLDLVLDFQEMGPGTVTVGPFAVTAVRTAHPVECHAVRLEADGRSLVYTADTGPSTDVTRLAEGASLLLGEASYLEGETNPPDLHLTGTDLGRMATEAGVGKLVVTHIPPWHEPAVALERAAAVFDGPTVLATTGGVHEL